VSYLISIIIIITQPLFPFQSITTGRATQQYPLTAIELATKGEEDTLEAGEQKTQ
jgi:hypothetical protein